MINAGKLDVPRAGDVCRQVSSVLDGHITIADPMEHEGRDPDNGQDVLLIFYGERSQLRVQVVAPCDAFCGHFWYGPGTFGMVQELSQAKGRWKPAPEAGF